ncbi:MAG: hypothetical protein ABEL76_15750 [Bradymonadaceae bacterium]
MRHAFDRTTAVVLLAALCAACASKQKEQEFVGSPPDPGRKRAEEKVYGEPGPEVERRISDQEIPVDRSQSGRKVSVQFAWPESGRTDYRFRYTRVDGAYRVDVEGRYTLGIDAADGVRRVSVVQADIGEVRTTGEAVPRLVPPWFGRLRGKWPTAVIAPDGTLRRVEEVGSLQKAFRERAGSYFRRTKNVGDPDRLAKSVASAYAFDREVAAHWFYTVGFWKGRTFEVGQRSTSSATVQYPSIHFGPLQVESVLEYEVPGRTGCTPSASKPECVLLRVSVRPDARKLKERADAFLTEVYGKGEQAPSVQRVEGEVTYEIVVAPGQQSVYALHRRRDEEVTVERDGRLDRRTTETKFAAQRMPSTSEDD